MGVIWEIIEAGKPYAKILEYAVIFATLIASIYSSRKAKATARELKQIAAQLPASSEELKETVQEITETLKSDFDAIARKLREDVTSLRADLRESREGDAASESVAGADATETAPSEDPSTKATRAVKREAHKQWWQPVVNMKFDDADQQQPRLYWSNNVRTPMPWPDTWLTGWRNVSSDGVCGVALSGSEESIAALWKVIRPMASRIEAKLPQGSSVNRGRFGIRITKPNKEFESDDQRRAWIEQQLNEFVTVLKPILVSAALARK